MLNMRRIRLIRLHACLILAGLGVGCGQLSIEDNGNIQSTHEASQVAQTVTINASNLLELAYPSDSQGHFTVWVDCSLRAAVRFDYRVRADLGDIKRPKKYTLENERGAQCSQTSNQTYKQSNSNLPNYDRGHLVPVMHMDDSEAAMQYINFMSNLVPQLASFNRGIWLRTERLIECWREQNELRVIGGAIYADPTNDYFLSTHSIPTAEEFWKVVIREDGQAVAWLFAHTLATAKSKDLDQWLIGSEDKLVSLLGGNLADFGIYSLATSTWSKPTKCDYS